MKKFLTALFALVTLASCTKTQTTVLSNCVMEVSRSGSGDVLRCEGHDPISLGKVDPVVRQCVLDATTPVVPQPPVPSNVVEPESDVPVSSAETKSTPVDEVVVPEEVEVSK